MVHRRLVNPVTNVPPADVETAANHFRRLLSLETDCWDVHVALESGHPGFVLLDVRGRDSFEQGHIAGAVHLPWAKITPRSLEPYPGETLFVVYCAGPHCNGADRAALRLSELGRFVKKMIGGVEGWRDDGFTLASSTR